MGQDPPAPFGPGATRRATVRVGVGVVVVRRERRDSSGDGCHNDHSSRRIYAGRRCGSHGATKLALPGGHLELNESWDQCARREVHEEMGLMIEETQFLHVTNDIMASEHKHYVTLFMLGFIGSDAPEPVNCEPDKCEGWQAYTVDELLSYLGRDELFSPLEHLLLEQPDKLREVCETA